MLNKTVLRWMFRVLMEIKVKNKKRQCGTELDML